MCSTHFVSSRDPQKAGGWESRGVKGWSRGGTWKFPKPSQTHRWLSVGGGGCMYIRMLHTYVCMYVFVTKS